MALGLKIQQHMYIDPCFGITTSTGYRSLRYFLIIIAHFCVISFNSYVILFFYSVLLFPFICPFFLLAQHLQFHIIFCCCYWAKPKKKEQPNCLPLPFIFFSFFAFGISFPRIQITTSLCLSIWIKSNIRPFRHIFFCWLLFVCVLFEEPHAKKEKNTTRIYYLFYGFWCISLSIK